VLKITGKGGKIRELPFNDRAKVALENFLLLNQHNSDDLLFPYDETTIYKAFKRYASRVGITKRVSPHSARATAITKALETGAVITDVADMAGHADIKTTQVYWKRRKGLEDSPVHKLDY
jgi:integrase/recombinase XerD